MYGRQIGSTNRIVHVKDEDSAYGKKVSKCPIQPAKHSQTSLQSGARDSSFAPTIRKSRRRQTDRQTYRQTDRRTDNICLCLAQAPWSEEQPLQGALASMWQKLGAHGPGICLVAASCFGLSVGRTLVATKVMARRSFGSAARLPAENLIVTFAQLPTWGAKCKCELEASCQGLD
jgi:hypothetical protein